MEKCSRIEVNDGQIMLPEPIIQRIQSFMTGKEAAQTTVLSKFWCSAWLTRPNLEFDQRSFSDRNGFDEYTRKTMQRYLQLNLMIYSFKLFVDDSSLGKELIVKAMKLRPVVFHLEIPALSTLVLPQEVLESEKLLRLSVTGCKIDAKATWSSLESLSLWYVCAQGNDIICDIILRCPLIEKLVSSECKCLFKSQNPNSETVTGCLALDQSLIDQYKFRRLKCLYLEKVQINDLFFSDFAARFPCLKDLTVLECFGCQEIQISSPTLERLTISDHYKMLVRAKFDVPRLCKFRFLCTSSVPSLLFERASKEFRVHIHIICRSVQISWIVKLNKFLRDLGLPVHSLGLVIGHMESESFDFPEDDGLPKPVVENLMMVINSSFFISFGSSVLEFSPQDHI